MSLRPGCTCPQPPRPRPVGALGASGRCAHISPLLRSGSLPPNSSVTPPRRTLYPSGGAKRTGDAVNPGVPGRGGRRSLPPDSQRTRSLPQPRAPQSRGLTPSAPTPTGEGHQRPAGAQLSRGQLWRVGEEALGSRHGPRSGSGLSQPLALSQAPRRCPPRGRAVGSGAQEGSEVE